MDDGIKMQVDGRREKELMPRSSRNYLTSSGGYIAGIVLIVSWTGLSNAN
ncbi:hypothetical protein K523DRAFT_359019 [Schizophyllum commune Tattone D]|nr:hypothetical protein K523DRAFT_359019 [Schizophyllum commune Tattone D]